MRILIATMGSYGDLNPYLALSRGLSARGHKVAIATSEIYRQDIERHGIGYFPMRPHTELTPEDYLKIMDVRKGSEYVVRQLVMPHLRGSYKDLEAAAKNADILISHMITYAAPVLAEKKGMPWISTVLQPMVFFSAYDPPVLAPAPWLSTLRPLGPKVNGPLLKFLKIFTRSWAKPVRKFRKALEASKKIKKNAVLVAGDAAEIISKDLPPEIVAVKTAPYHWLFPQCSAIVHQGGVGTTAQAMRSGKPEIVIPFSHDQFDNADRIQKLGIGISLRKKDTTPEKLASTLSQLLSDSRYVQSAEKIGKTVRAEDGIGEACNTIEQVLYNKNP